MQHVDSRAVTRATLRPQVANAETNEVIAMMFRDGWGFEASVKSYNDPKRYVAKFVRWDWLKVPLGVGLGYGYSTPELDTLSFSDQAIEMDLAVRKAAELAMRVQETFIDCLPRSSSEMDGKIVPESKYHQDAFMDSRRKFEDPDFVARRSDRVDNRVFDDPDNGQILSVDRGFFMMRFGEREIILRDQDIDRLERGLEMFRMKKAGKMAF